MTKKRTELNQPGSPPKALVIALRKLLRPLVQLLLKFQVTYPFLSEMLKSLYVEVAEEDFKLEGKKQTDTRISMLTGVHRKDTKRLRAQDQDEQQMPSSVSVGAQILAVWLSDEQYLTADGDPNILPFKLCDRPSFEGLVASVCKQDIRARVVLDEWLNLGIAQVDGEGNVHLLSEAFIPDKGIEEKAFYLGMNVADHISAASHNLQGEAPPYFERCVYYDGLSENDVAELNNIVHQQGMDLLKALNKKALSLKNKSPKKESIKDLDKNSEGLSFRMNTGLYFYSEPQVISDTHSSPEAEQDSSNESSPSRGEA